MRGDPQKIGDRLDTLGVQAHLEDDELVSDAIVILQVVEANGDVRVHVCWSDGTTWINRRGMFEAARDYEIVPPPPRTEP